MAKRGTVVHHEQGVQWHVVELRLEIEVLNQRARTARLRGRALVDGALVAEADMLSTMVDREGAAAGGPGRP